MSLLQGLGVKRPPEPSIPLSPESSIRVRVADYNIASGIRKKAGISVVPDRKPVFTEQDSV